MSNATSISCSGFAALARTLAVIAVLAARLFAGEPGDATDEPEFHSSDFSGSESCRECHPRQYLEWRGSAHAYALVDPVFRSCQKQALREGHEDAARLCLGCHSPIGVRSGELGTSFDPDELPAVIREGVNCESCHAVPGPKRDHPIANAGFELSADDVFYGRLHKPEDNPAHESATSEYIAKSEFCGSCHDVVHKGRQIESAFVEWSESVYRKRGVECQNCHMLHYAGQAAVGGPFRERLRRHNFPGVSIPLIRFPNIGYQREEVQKFLRKSVRTAIRVPATAKSGAELPLTVRVKNSGAGHNLPSGSMRQMWIEVTATSAAGRVLYRSGHLDANGDLMDDQSELLPKGDPDLVEFSDRHVDESGSDVPFWRAAALREKSIRPFEVRNALYRIPVPDDLEGSSLTVRVRVRLRSEAPFRLRHSGNPKLAARLPIFEMDSFESKPIPVLAEPPRRTEYRVPDDFPDPDAALVALRDGDRVLVDPGEYVLRRPLDFRGKAVSLISTRGPDHTTLRLASELAPEDDRSVVVFRGSEGPRSRLEGFTITGGTGTFLDGVRRGGGVHIRRASPTVTDNRIVGNSAAGGVGGGVCVDDGTPRLDGNEILDCEAELGGGVAWRGSPERPVTTSANSVQGNVARRGGGIYIERGSHIRIERTVVAGNIAHESGGAVFVADGATVDLDRVTLVRNRAERSFGAIRAPTTTRIDIANSILWSNEPFEVDAEFAYCLLDREVSPPSTNLNAEPLFVDASGVWDVQPDAGRPAGTRPEQRWLPGDYHLLPGSAAIDAADPAAPADGDDSRADIGALFLERPLRAFIRGDVDGSGKVEWADVVLLRQHILRDTKLPCLDAADADDNGSVDLNDASLLVSYLSLETPTPAPPFPDCSLDPTFGEGLSCQVEAAPCRRQTVPTILPEDRDRYRDIEARRRGR